MSNTTELQSYQLRVIEEKKELDIKAKALSQFIGEGAIFPTLDAAEQERLKEQCELMWEYSQILSERIAAFGTDATQMPHSKRATIRVSLVQMAKAFEAWENDYRADPQSFMTDEEVAAAEVSQLSARRASYFHELLNTVAKT